MNGARSIFMRKGYWLTALAAAVLLAASPGTALAQSVGFVGSSSTMMEGASPAMTPAPITIDINVSGLTAPSDGEDGDLKEWSWDTHGPARRRRRVPWARCSHGRQPSDLDRFQ